MGQQVKSLEAACLNRSVYREKRELILPRSQTSGFELLAYLA